MKLFISLCCLLLVSSCVYYGTTREIAQESNSTCSSGSVQENKQCRADIRKLNESISKQQKK